jgi:hypothetical protein
MAEAEQIRCPPAAANHCSRDEDHYLPPARRWLLEPSLPWAVDIFSAGRAVSPRIADRCPDGADPWYEPRNPLFLATDR